MTTPQRNGPAILGDDVHEAPPEGVLTGVRVLDFSRILAGPFAAQILGDLGADVVKIEVPGGEELRTPNGGASASFAAYNRNKRGLVLDLTVSESRLVVERLIQSADVLVHNFRPGVAERIGLGYEEVRAQNPRLVYCSVSGFGSSGPMAASPAVDLIIQAYSGLLSFTGEPGRDPVRVPVSIADLSTGLYAALAILAGLMWRQRTGQGQKVETSLLESVLSLESAYLTRFFASGELPEPMGTQNVGMGLPNQVFAVKDGWVAIAAANDAMWARFCGAIDATDLLEDPRFSTLPDRGRNRPELVARISARLIEFDLADCLTRLRAARVVCSPVQSIDQVAEDPQVRDLGIIQQVSHGDETFDVVASPLHLSESPPSIRFGPPTLNHDVDRLLAELGYGADEVALLKDRGVFGDR